MTFAVTNRSFFEFLGGLVITSASAGSYANEIDGANSVPKSIHKMRIVGNAMGRPEEREKRKRKRERKRRGDGDGI